MAAKRKRSSPAEIKKFWAEREAADKELLAECKEENAKLDALLAKLHRAEKKIAAEHKKTMRVIDKEIKDLEREGRRLRRHQ